MNRFGISNDIHVYWMNIIFNGSGYQLLEFPFLFFFKFFFLITVLVYDSVSAMHF